MSRLFSHMSLKEKLQHRSEPGPNGCRLWVRGKSCGYGSLMHEGHYWAAHRLAWIAENGPIPDGLHVLHKCDVRACINPAHLFLGTNADNMADKMRKGRHRVPRGEEHCLCTVSDATVSQIREASGTHAKIAERFGVSRSFVTMIRNGRRRPIAGAAR